MHLRDPSAHRREQVVELAITHRLDVDAGAVDFGQDRFRAGDTRSCEPRKLSPQST